MFFCIGCQTEENLDLVDFSTITANVSVCGAENDASTITLRALYNGDGELILEDKVPQQYVISLNTASPEDIVLYLEPIVTNIPTEKVVLSDTELHFPAGTVSRTISVTLTDEEFAFAQTERGEKKYEAGVRIIGLRGRDVVLAESEAKIIVEKDAYRASVSLVGVDEEETDFELPYWDGEIFSDTPIRYTFKAQLDRPAMADVTVTVSVDGMEPQYASFSSFSVEKLIIPAGQKESTESATWTLQNTYFEQTDPMSYTLMLTPNIQSDDIAVSNGTSPVFTIKKFFQALSIESEIPAGWELLDRKGWSVTGELSVPNSGATTEGLENILDGDESTNWGASQIFTVNIDMQANRDISGLVIRYFVNAWNEPYSSQRVNILISDNNEDWTSLGSYKFDLMPLHIFKCLSTMTTRYIRLEIEPPLNPWGMYNRVGINELEIYSAK